MSNWKEADVRAALAAKNLKISGGRDGSLHVLDPFNYDVQFANLAEEDRSVTEPVIEGGRHARICRTKLNDFETGKISRRKLIETLTLAATTAYAAEQRAGAGETRSRRSSSTTSPTPVLTSRRPRTGTRWCSTCDQVGQTKRDVVVVSARRASKPYNVTAKDVPHSTSSSARPTARRARRSAGTCAGAGGDRPRQLTVLNFNRAEAKAKLTAMGVKNVRDGGLYSLHMDDAFGYDVQLSGLDNNAADRRLARQRLRRLCRRSLFVCGAVTSQRPV